MDPFRQSAPINPWRSAFEFGAAIMWLLCAACTALILKYSPFPAEPFYWVLAISLGFAVLRFYEASRVWEMRINLLGKGVLLTPLHEYIHHSEENPEHLWLGKGFLWKKEHTQRLYDLRRSEEKNVLPPQWYANFRGKIVQQQDPDAAGMPWIHGVSDSEEDIHLPFALLEGNTMIVGTTGSGKSTLLRCIIAACIRRGDTLVVLDPKGDKSLEDAMRKTCESTPGREKDFVYFHKAFPGKSCRYDVLKNFSAITSLSSRLSSQIATSSTGPDQFIDFSWRVINIYAQLLIACGQRPSIALVRRNVEAGIEPLIERALVARFEHKLPGRWRNEVARYLDMAKSDKLNKPTKTTSDKVVAYVEYYQQTLFKDDPFEPIDSAINLYFHNREHYGKMIASLIPMLTKLDSGELSGLLSPRYDDIDDDRPIYDSSAIVDGNKVFYLASDALSDSYVSSAILSIIVSDMTAVAGARYSYGAAPRRITMIVDEANEVVNDSFHQLASKGRGAGYQLWAASQTIPDYVVRLGSEEKAMSTLGNFNNLISLRIKDQTTQEYVAEQFGKAFVDSKRFALTTSTNSDNSATGFTGGEGVSMSDELIETIPPEVLGKLPNHQYFALLAGGRLYKGRQPLIV